MIRISRPAAYTVEPSLVMATLFWPDSHFPILFNMATPDINMGIHPVILWPISDQINSIPLSSTSFYSENEQQPPPKPMIEQPYN